MFLSVKKKKYESFWKQQNRGLLQGESGIKKTKNTRRKREKQSENNIIKDVINLFGKKKQLNVNYLDIRTHFGEDYYKPVSLGIFIAAFMLIIEVMVTK